MGGLYQCGTCHWISRDGRCFNSRAPHGLNRDQMSPNDSCSYYMMNPNLKSALEAQEREERERKERAERERMERERREAALKAFKQAIEKYTEELRVNPNSASAYYNRGVAYNEQGYYDQAFRDFEQAVNLESASNTYREALKKIEERPEIKEVKLKREIEKYTEELRINPNSASAYYNRGLAFQKQNNESAALEDFGKAANLEPANNSYCAAHRETLEKKKAKEEAEQKAIEFRRKEEKARKKRNRLIRCIIGGIIGIPTRIPFASLAWLLSGASISVTVILISGVLFGIVPGIIIAYRTGLRPSVGAAARTGLILGGITFAIISVLFLIIFTDHTHGFMVLGTVAFRSAVRGIIGGAIIGIFGGIFRDYK